MTLKRIDKLVGMRRDQEQEEIQITYTITQTYVN